MVTAKMAGKLNRPHTAVVCDYDPIWLARAKARVAGAGFEVLGEAVNVVDALNRSRELEPSLIVVTNEHYGLTALDAIADFRAQRHAPEVLVLSTSEVDRQFFLDRGALLLVGRFDDAGFDRALADAAEFLVTGNRRQSSDRRTRPDRRQRQDWRMVSTERRRGGDRRSADRRAQRDRLPDEPDLHLVLARAIAKANSVAAAAALEASNPPRVTSER